MGSLPCRSPLGNETGIIDLMDRMQTHLGRLSQLDFSPVPSEVEAWSNALGEAVPFGIWLYNAAGDPLVVSESFLKLVGMSKDEIKNLGWTKCMAPEDVGPFRFKWEKCFTTGEDWRDEIRVKGVDGQWYTILCMGRPLRNRSGKINHWLGIKLDITERKHFEEELKAAKLQAEKASDAKTAFLANMSHEIRTPLGAMIGFAQLLLEQDLPPQDVRKHLEVIVANGRSLNSIVNDILDLSKVESSHLRLDLQPFDLSDLFKDVEALFQQAAVEKGLELKFVKSDLLPVRIVSDVIRLRQILVNLIGNALKFTEKGFVEVKVSSLRTSQTQGTLVVDVIDTGLGISDIEQKNLFSPFHQGHTTPLRRFGGTGLGLSLSKRLAEKLGGHLNLVVSEVNGGSIFRLTLPFDRVKESTPLSFGAVPNRPNPSESKISLRLDGMSVLVVDDSDDHRFLVSRFLELAGAHVTLACDGREGVNRALSGHFDVILMDLQMPKVDGYQAVRLLRQNDYARPVIALTAHAMRDERQTCLNSGFDEYLAKPIDRDLLSQTLRLFTGIRNQ